MAHKVGLCSGSALLIAEEFYPGTHSTQQSGISLSTDGFPGLAMVYNWFFKGQLRERGKKHN